MTAQQVQPIIPAKRVRRFAAEESVMYLMPPPFFTIAILLVKQGEQDFWHLFGALDQIHPERALIIGDFGLGSDSPIILDYARNAINPPVLRLRWASEAGKSNEWVIGASCFDEFATMLGLE